MRCAPNARDDYSAHFEHADFMNSFVIALDMNKYVSICAMCSSLNIFTHMQFVLILLVQIWVIILCGRHIVKKRL